jgi:hypothetical protein
VLLPRQQAKLTRGAKDKEHAMSHVKTKTRHADRSRGLGSPLAPQIPQVFLWPTSKSSALYARCCSGDHWGLEV